MKDIYSQEQIDEMRKRLYARGSTIDASKRHELTDTEVDVSRNWQVDTDSEPRVSDMRESMPADIDQQPVSEKPAPKKRFYRRFILLGSVLIFILVAGISSLFLYFGGNQISGENILLSISGPSTIGGGEVYPLQIAITNENSVPIQAATMIIKYPPGSRSVEANPRSLYEERIPLENLAPGEVRNIGARAAIFGEENSEKNIEATLEYRIENSNGTFYKDADLLPFRITSSPLVLRIENVQKVAAGQLVDITITAVSNASSPLKDVLVSASFPNGFAFETADPAPIFGNNVWKIDELLPEETKSITVRGIVRGLTEEEFRINFEAGQASADNQYIVEAALVEARADFIIERPFIGVDIAIENTRGKTAILEEQAVASVDIDIKNTLDETVYDMVVEVIPKGNALTEGSIRSGQGFYDSNNETVRWEVANNSSFSQVLPGDSRTLQFTVVPSKNRSTASFELDVNVYARRVAESSAAETLIGTARAEAKYSSSVSLGSQVGRSSSLFTDTGPVPPTVGQSTTYTLTLVAEAGANDMVNTVINTGLPTYVNWLDAYDADGAVTYNSVAKTLQWAIGDIPTGEKRELSFQVSILPSTSQVGSSPTLMKTQTLKANDRFTGALLQDTASAVTTELSAEMGFAKENGKVVR